MLTKDLIEFGLGEKEAKVYLALLELEIANVNEIAKKAGVNRSSAYVTLESLKKRGLVSISDYKTVRQYVATSPEAILRIAEDRAIDQENVRKRIEEIIPEMKALFKGTKKKPLVRVFEGKEGLISCFEDTLKCKEKLMRVSSSMKGLPKIIPEYLQEYAKNRFKLGVKMHGIHPNDEFSEIMMKATPPRFDMSIIIPEEKYKPSADLAIYDNKIGYMSAENGGIAVIIESKEMADVMKNIFDLAFEEAKRLNKQLDKKK